jgi:hypothetical protein
MLEVALAESDDVMGMMSGKAEDELALLVDRKSTRLNSSH